MPSPQALKDHAPVNKTVQKTSRTAVVADASVTTVVTCGMVMLVRPGSQPALVHASFDLAHTCVRMCTLKARHLSTNVSQKRRLL